MQVAIWRLVACWISKATRAEAHASVRASTRMHLPMRLKRARTRTPREICNTYCFSSATMVTWTRVGVTLYVYCMSWVCCVCSGLCDGLITYSEESYRMCVCDCVWDLETWKRGGLGSIWAVVPQKKKIFSRHEDSCHLTKVNWAVWRHRL